MCMCVWCIHADVSDHLRYWFLIYSEARSLLLLLLCCIHLQAGLQASRDRPSYLHTKCCVARLSFTRVLETQTQVHTCEWIARQSFTLAKIAFLVFVFFTVIILTNFLWNAIRIRLAAEILLKCLINFQLLWVGWVSENPERWDYFKVLQIPQLLGKSQEGVWSAGCAMG